VRLHNDEQFCREERAVEVIRHSSEKRCFRSFVATIGGGGGIGCMGRKG
jgi:hypothetical protein